MDETELKPENFGAEHSPPTGDEVEPWTVVAENLTLPECPRWHRGRFWFSDFYDGTVSSFAPLGEIQTEFRFRGQAGGLGWLPDGDLLVVSMLERKLLRIKNGAAQTYADLSQQVHGPLNDLLVRPDGHCYVGGFGYDLFGGEPPRDSPLIQVDHEGRSHVAAEHLRFPNGMTLLGDETLVVAETFAGRLSAFRLRSDGSLGMRRTWAKLAGTPTPTPDGIAADADTSIWVADPDGRRVIRVDEKGKLLATIGTAPDRPFACALGGSDGRSLLICVGRSPDPEKARQRRAGRLLLMRIDVPAPRMENTHVAH